MGITNLLSGLLGFKKGVKLDLKKLPSQGIFYKNDFWIRIKKAEEEDIINYNHRYDRKDALLVINIIKDIVRKNTFLPKGYKFESIMSIDIMFIFFEIVSLTKNKDITIIHNHQSVKFNSDTFNYFNIPEEIQKRFDDSNKEFVIEDFKYKLPTIGIENSVTNFLVNKQISGKAEDYMNLSYNFMYFLGDKETLTEEEIENLVIIFNDELEDDDKKTIDKIVKEFEGFMKYSLKTPDGRIVPLNELDLMDIWK